MTMNLPQRRVKVLGNRITSVENVVKGLIAYIASYLSSMQYEIAHYRDENDIVIIIRIKDIAPYIMEQS